jgi:hypothetical protein
MGGDGIARLGGLHVEVVPDLLGQVLLKAVTVKEESKFAEKVGHTILRHTIQ